MVRAIDVEVKRQIKRYEKGEAVIQATLGWDEAAGKITIQRYKERPDEYRYFPEPDLPIVEVSRAWVAEIQARLPELPEAKRTRFIEELGLTEYDAGVLVADKAIADYFEAILGAVDGVDGVEAKSVANWVTGDLFRLLNEHKVDREELDKTNISAENFAKMIALVEKGTINANTARSKVLTIMWAEGKDAAQIVEDEGLAQISDTGAIAAKVQEAIDSNPAMVEKYLAGNEKLVNAIFGQAMRLLQGKGDPQVVRSVLQDKLNTMK